MASALAEPEDGGLDDSLRALLTALGLKPELQGTIRETVARALQATKQARVSFACRHCGRKENVTVEVDDSRAAMDAVEKLVTLTEGRSGTTDVQSAAVIVRRTDVSSAKEA